ncbi:MAG: hypothetical protein JWN77_778 [Frankiales bacterium]|jgi:hypothetical protein|nr:hypothetical protein [Frankiales bacterium]
MQSQLPLSPYVGLWSRVDGFTPELLVELLEARQVVRIVLQRNTVHLVTAEDARAFRPVLQEVVVRDLRRYGTLPDGLASVVQELASSPVSRASLRAELVARYPSVAPAALAHAARGLRPLVQVPPRGVWGSGGQVTYADLESWSGPPLPSSVGSCCATSPRTGRRRSRTCRPGAG